MFHYLLLMFLLDPSSGEVGKIQRPVASLEECRSLGIETTKKASAAGLGILGTCVSIDDFKGDT